MARRVIRQSPGAKPGFFYGYIVVVVALLIMVASFALYNSFGVFFKPVTTEFGWTRAMTSGAYSLYYLLHGFSTFSLAG